MQVLWCIPHNSSWNQLCKCQHKWSIFILQVTFQYKASKYKSVTKKVASLDNFTGENIGLLVVKNGLVISIKAYCQQMAVGYRNVFRIRMFFQQCFYSQLHFWASELYLVCICIHSSYSKIKLCNERRMLQVYMGINRWRNSPTISQWQ